MSDVKSRRELYSDATKEALLEQATTQFAERGFVATSLDGIAAAALVTRGAVYHHFAGKKALFEAVLDRLSVEVIKRVAAVAAQYSDPTDAALAALDIYLTESCDPLYGKIAWQEGPIALGRERWRMCEREHSYALVETMVATLMESGFLEHRHMETTVRVFYEILSGAGLVIVEAAPEDKQRVRDECSELMTRLVFGLSKTPAPIERQVAPLIARSEDGTARRSPSKAP